MLRPSLPVGNGSVKCDIQKIIGTAAAALGYPKLKPEQEQAVGAFVGGADVFVSLPTGYGKSLCFGLLPRVFDLLRGVENQSIAIVVSPLLAIMKEQVAFFSAKGLSAACISDKEDRDATIDKRRGVRKGEYQLVFFSPEALFATLEWRRMLASDLYRSHLVAFVNEAHCVKKWSRGMHVTALRRRCIFRR